MLTNTKVAETIRDAGHGELPSECRFIPLNRELTEEVVIAPDSPMPKIYYLKEDGSGVVTHFKAM